MHLPGANPLNALLHANAPASEERAWATFLSQHSQLFLQVARSLGGDHDVVMDRYAFILEALRQQNCRRLRTFDPAGGGQLTTWLIIVSRRLCLDHYRQRYGRKRSESAASVAERSDRRQLSDLLGGALGLETLVMPSDEVPDEALLKAQLRAGLERALATLEPADRLVLRLRFEDERSVPEIARILGEASPFKLYRRLDRILASLRRVLEEMGIADSVP
jgi:RNA polymerase sigma-70 factor (ECF subfamily)